ncbi:MAG: HK97 family phage prohead protease [Frankiaceae bacterium]
MSDKEIRKALPAGPQVRSYPAEFEVRGLAGSMVELRGYASTTGQPYEMYDMFGAYTEIVAPGAFTKTLADGADVAYLANHEGLTLARTKNGTLQLSEDSSGLMTVARMNTTRTDARDLVTAVEDGDVDEMSFAFRVVRQQWSPDYDQRDMVELNLNRGDVSAVNYGANPTTNVGLQRAFRKQRPAELHRMAVELREGKPLSSSTMDVLSQVLDLLASADDAVDQAQPLLADLMGVPNPDADEADAAAIEEGESEDNARALAYLETLRRAEQHRRERAAL